MWGVDVSSHNGSNIQDIIDHNDFIFIKATQGDYYVNPCLTAQTNQVKAAGKKYGFYHFIYGGIDAKKQAQFFIDNCAPEGFEDGVALILDFENHDGYPTLSGNEPREMADYIFEKTGKRVMIYMSVADARGGGHGYTWDDMKDFPLWVAGYPYSASNPHAYDNFSDDLQKWADANFFQNFPYWNVITIWQYSEQPYDRNIFYGDDRVWNALFGTKQEQQPAQQPQSESQAPQSTAPVVSESTSQATQPQTSQSTANNQDAQRLVVALDDAQNKQNQLDEIGKLAAQIVDRTK